MEYVLISLMLTVLLLIFIIYNYNSKQSSFQFHSLPSLREDYLNNLSVSII